MQPTLSTLTASTTKGYKGMGMEGLTAKWYASLTRKNLDRFKELAHRISGQIPPGSKVLEVAPGPGYFAIELAKRGNYQITGIDISETFVTMARSNAAEANVKVDFRRGNASGMPCSSESFDLVVCCAAFKNFTEPLQAMREMYRVLKPGGRGLIIDFRRDTSNEQIGQAVEEMHLGTVNRMITNLTFRYMLRKRAYTRSEFEEFAAQTKFASVEIEEHPIALEVTLHKAGPTEKAISASSSTVPA
jgi:ubiquinone/menaquinone biosynthesis C-methylase UbiE